MIHVIGERYYWTRATKIPTNASCWARGVLVPLHQDISWQPLDRGDHQGLGGSDNPGKQISCRIKTYYVLTSLPLVVIPSHFYSSDPLHPYPSIVLSYPILSFENNHGNNT